MTDAQARAKAVYEQLGNSTEMVLGQGVDVLKMQDDDLAVIAAALAQVEAETWERAAVIVEEQAHSVWFDHVRAAYEEAARLLRQQAQRAKEGA